MDKLSLSTSDTFTTSNNLEKLPNEIIMMILEKIPPSLVFTLIKSSKKINTLFNKSKNSIILYALCIATFLQILSYYIFTLTYL